MTTLNDLKVTGEDYISLNAASNPPIPVGTALELQNKGVQGIRIQESSTKPDATSTTGFVITDITNSNSTPRILEGSLEIWVKCVKEDSSSTLAIGTF